jgi:hypothetical protein
MRRGERYTVRTAFSAVIKSCNGLSSWFPGKAGMVELCAIFSNMVVWRWEQKPCLHMNSFRRSSSASEFRISHCAVAALTLLPFKVIIHIHIRAQLTPTLPLHRLLPTARRFALPRGDPKCHGFLHFEKFSSYHLPHDVAQTDCRRNNEDQGFVTLYLTLGPHSYKHTCSASPSPDSLRSIRRNPFQGE